MKEQKWEFSLETITKVRQIDPEKLQYKWIGQEWLKYQKEAK